MAIASSLTATSLLLCSLLVVIASANDYGATKPQGEENTNYETNPMPKGEEEKLHSYGTKPNSYKPKLLPVGVEGLVLCKSGPNYYPIQGALARITCLAVDDNGYETTHSVCSGETDAKGYFFARLMSSLDDEYLSNLTDCKAFLESSPLDNCNVPVDVNNGITGTPLSDFRVLDHMRMKLFSVGPFFFTPEPKSVSNGY